MSMNYVTLNGGQGQKFSYKPCGILKSLALWTGRGLIPCKFTLRNLWMFLNIYDAKIFDYQLIYLNYLVRYDLKYIN